jgi:capsular polysaccharide biosynthesis protein
LKVRRLDEGIYDLADVIVPLKPPSPMIVALNRALIMPFVMGQVGVADPLREFGPVKLFVRRDMAANGRNLTNQHEVESWFVARGYTPVRPGLLTMAEQVLLFSRATHIAGIEGAAFANILFAVNAVHIVMICSPLVREEKFFSALVKHSNVKFERLFGDATSPKRNADFSLPMQALKGVTLT